MESITRLQWSRRKREVLLASSFPLKRSNRTWTWTIPFSRCLPRNQKRRSQRLENNLPHQEFPDLSRSRGWLRYKIAEDTAAMNKSIRCLVHSGGILGDPARAQEAKFDS